MVSSITTQDLVSVLWNGGVTTIHVTAAAVTAFVVHQLFHDSRRSREDGSLATVGACVAGIGASIYLTRYLPVIPIEEGKRLVLGVIPLFIAALGCPFAYELCL